MKLYNRHGVELGCSPMQVELTVEEVNKVQDHLNHALRHNMAVYWPECEGGREMLMVLAGRWVDVSSLLQR